MVFKNNIKRLPSVIICAGRLYSTSFPDTPLAGAKNDTRINEIIQLIINTKNFNTALTHKSYASVDSSAKSYDTIEFLGDAILEYYVSLFLYFSYLDYSEGRLTNERGLLVSTNNLASISLEIGLYKHLRMGKSKQNVDFTSKSLSKGDKKILADIFESFIAALIIEKGNKLLLEFLSLTIFNKDEFKSKLINFNNAIVPKIYSFNKDLSVVEDTVANTIISSKEHKDNILSKEDKEDNISYNSISGIIDNNIRDKSLVYMDKSLKNQEQIIELLIKMYVLIECNSKKGL
jgi:dsRNA-specific ribonuclease